MLSFVVHSTELFKAFAPNTPGISDAESGSELPIEMCNIKEIYRQSEYYDICVLFLEVVDKKQFDQSCKYILKY